ncbi:ubiquitin-conjugating enzyme/RWD-like protein [Paraphysoderma sedebokerense]|nr:ubiquitin-conjugating enzyme/RWD-like protein [Paraphysoderma sedebokerense]
MATKAAYKRLTKEYLNIQKSPPPLITAKPLETNILEWHYVLLGPKDTPYEGGQYHGKLTFPPEYPYKPPSIRMITPSGRFTPNARICLSMSDYHPSTWNPGWSVATVLNGLLSFMVSDESAAGTMKCDEDERRRLARHSWDFNKNSKIFQGNVYKIMTSGFMRCVRMNDNYSNLF